MPNANEYNSLFCQISVLRADVDVGYIEFLDFLNEA